MNKKPLQKRKYSNFKYAERKGNLNFVSRLKSMLLFHKKMIHWSWPCLHVVALSFTSFYQFNENIAWAITDSTNSIEPYRFSRVFCTSEKNPRHTKSRELFYGIWNNWEYIVQNDKWDHTTQFNSTRSES